MISAEASARITQQIDSVLAHPEQIGDDGLVAAITQMRLWPVYGDLGGRLLLGTDGQVYARDHNTLEVTLESDLRWKLIAWVTAVERVPELRELLPDRPLDAPDCWVCRGTGRHPIGVGRVICGTCSGLGWICEQLPE